MIDLISTLGALTLVISALLLGRDGDPRRARRRALIVLGGLFALVLGSLLFLARRDALLLGDGFTLVPEGGLRRAAPLVDVVIGLIAVALAPTATHPSRVISAILLLIATALGSLAFEHGIGFALCWIASIGICHRALVQTGDDAGAARVFIRYHGLSAALIAIGLLLQLFGVVVAGAVFWVLAIGIREAVIPAHGWLPRVMDRAPLGLVVAFVAPQIGVVGHMAHLQGHIPHGYAETVAVFAGLTALGGAALGLSQPSARRAVSWLVISQTGLVALGLESLSGVGRDGAVMMWQVMAVATSGFVMTVAAVEARRGTLRLDELGGSFAQTPRMAVGFLILGFSSVGLPATLGFVAEDLLVQGTSEEFPILSLVLILTTALNAINVLRCFFALFSGSNDRVGEVDLGRREWFAVTLAMTILVVGGCLPWLLTH